MVDAARSPCGAGRVSRHAELVKRLVATEPDITLEELRHRLAEEGVVIGRSSIDRYLTALGLTRKKRRAMRPSRPGRTSLVPGRRGRPTSRP